MKETTTPTTEYGEWQAGEPVWNKMPVWRRMVEKVKNFLRKLK